MIEKTQKTVQRKILCPRCGELTRWEDNPTRPFCSERCQMVDLGSWAEEKYRIPTEEAPGMEDSEE